MDELYDSLNEDGLYELKRDKKDNGYKKSIREFMRQIGGGEFVVVVVSDKYLKSSNCMFELLEIFRKSNSKPEEFKERVFPVVLPDAKIYDPIDRLGYVEFWVEKYQELEEKIKKVGLANAKSTMPELDTYYEIRESVGHLGGILADLNASNPQNLKKDNFDVIKNSIVERALKLIQ